LKKDLVSIIIPVWKPNFKHLKQCLDSALNQTYPDIEIILVYKEFPNYDAEFYNFIKKYDKKKIKVFTYNENGVSRARNFAIQNSSGEYIAILDSDDYSESNRIEKQMDIKKKLQYDVIGSWAYSISDTGEKLQNIQKPITPKQIRKKMLLHNPILHSSILMHRKMLDKIGAYDESFNYSEDYELFFRAMANGFKFYNIPEYLVNIRINPQSITRKSSWKKIRPYTVKAKNKAFFHYGFSKPLDIFYYLFTPFDYLIPPKVTSKAKKIIAQS